MTGLPFPHAATAECVSGWEPAYPVDQLLCSGCLAPVTPHGFHADGRSRCPEPPSRHWRDLL